jgi:hypothetical protein
LLETLDDITKRAANNKQIDIILLEFSKAWWSLMWYVCMLFLCVHRFKLRVWYFCVVFCFTARRYPWLSLNGDIPDASSRIMQCKTLQSLKIGYTNCWETLNHTKPQDQTTYMLDILTRTGTRTDSGYHFASLHVGILGCLLMGIYLMHLVFCSWYSCKIVYCCLLALDWWCRISTCYLYTQEDHTNIPHKGPSPYSAMQNITITENGVYKLLRNIKPHKATGPDNIHLYTPFSVIVIFCIAEYGDGPLCGMFVWSSCVYR